MEATRLSAPARLALGGHRDGALALGSATPRISWTVPEAPSGWVQEEAVVEITRVVGGRRSSRSFAVGGAARIRTGWPDEPLRSRERVELRVRVAGGGLTSPWSDAAVFETGLMQPSDWAAQMVGPGWPEAPGTDRRPALVRTEAVLRGAPVRARLYVTAHGLVEMEVNGRRVGRDELVPGWTVYGERLAYRAYDVTGLVEEGSVAVGAWLGDGWYRGRIGFEGGSFDNFGTDLGVMAQLEVGFADGTTQTVATDGSWQAGFGPILFSGLYEGETYDAREMPEGWSRAGFSGTPAASGFSPVHVGRRDPATLVAPSAEPVRCAGRIEPVSVEPRGEGRYLVDFGQNASGRLRLRIDAPRGTTVTIRHAEVLEGGELGTRPLRRAAATDSYTSDGRGPAEWEPRFTIHGFRYAEVSGWHGPLRPGDAVFRVLHTDIERTGWFECSHPGVTRLHRNVVWSTRSNFVSIPTDCPQRDERLGWLGDIQVFCPTAQYLFDVAPMLTDWLRDVWIEQRRVGAGVPVYVPWIPGGFWNGKNAIAAWGDATTVVPWSLYEQTGDRDVLARQLPSAQKWVEDILGLAGPSRVWDSGPQLGDWLDPSAPPDNPLQAMTDAHLIATAYMARSTRLLGLMHETLGHAGEARRWAAEASAVAEAFRGRYALDEDGRLSSDTQAAYALALAFDLLTPEQRLGAGERLAELVRAAGGAISTGFAGTPVVTRALQDTGHLEEAYLLLEHEDCPSWLYPVSMGATTTWERWDSMLPDGTINPGEMTSFNHYALGAVAQWLHESVAGLAPDAPGYRRIRFAPRPGGSLTWARTTRQTPYGLAGIEWKIEGGTMTVRGRVPVGATGILDLPGLPVETVGHGAFTRSVAL
jgi:alpha-L-rhamnosidase